MASHLLVLTSTLSFKGISLVSCVAKPNLLVRRYSYESVASIPTKGLYFSEKFMNVKKVLMETFIGPPETGVYSPYVQRTLYLMGSAVLRRFADVSSIHLKMPNIHFLPVNLSTKENPSMVKIPYQTNKATLVQKIAKLVENKTLEGIGDMRDESDRNGMRVVNEGSLAAKRALKLVGSKSVLKSSLYGKRADCSSTNPEESEIFIVNGNFAGGSAKQGRDRRFQAILPLNGKILNTERKDEAAMYKNEDIQNLILGLGLGVNGEDFKMENLRYHKIIILTDADVDGAYRRALLLTFFFRYQRALFDAGCIYLGEPPVYKVERGKHAQYCYDEAELEKIISTFPTNTSFNTRRFKGLGEMMPIELWETTMNPETRMIKQLFIGDTTEANMTFSSLMGTRVDVWREVVTNAASRINLETLDI